MINVLLGTDRRRDEGRDPIQGATAAELQDMGIDPCLVACLSVIESQRTDIKDGCKQRKKKNTLSINTVSTTDGKDNDKGMQQYMMKP